MLGASSYTYAEATWTQGLAEWIASQAFRSCLGILRLAKSYGEARLEAAAQRALAIASHSYRSVESIPRFRRSGAGLAHRLDVTPPEPVEPTAPVEHHNIRGPDYYA